jgi:high-affinity iron transporter
MVHTDANKLDGVEETGNSGDVATVASFLAAFGIIVREGIEAMLVLGAIIAYLMKAGQRKSLRHVYLGAILGVVCSFIVAAILYSMGMGNGSEQQEIIEGVTALIAVCMLYWVSNWMLSKSETEAWNNYIKKQVAGAAVTGSVFALAFTAWLAVFREGAEVVLFLYPLVTSTDPMVIWGGILVGFVVLAIIFVIMRVYSVKLPLKPFFMVMSTLMFIMAISFLGSGITELIEGNVITGTYIPWIPTGNEVLTVLGINPWVETIVPQILLLLVTVVIYIVHFRKEKNSKASGQEMIDPSAAV